MKAVVIKEGGILLWCEVPDPVLKEGYVIIKIHASGVNRADLLQAAGKYPPPPGWPDYPGLECAGVIEEAAPGSRWQKGDRVCALLGGGGYAEYVAVKYDMLMPVPKGLSMVEAAALPEAYATSYLNLFIEGHLEHGAVLPLLDDRLETWNVGTLDLDEYSVGVRLDELAHRLDLLDEVHHEQLSEDTD